MAKRKQSRLKHSDVVKQCERHNWFFQIRSVSIDDYLTLLNNCIDDDVQPKHPFNYVAFSYTWFKQNDSRSSTEFVVNITGYIQLQTPLKMTSAMLEQRIGLSVQTYGPDDQYLGHVEKYLTPKIIRLIVFQIANITLRLERQDKEDETLLLSVLTKKWRFNQTSNCHRNVTPSE
jgi:hypothetical protein